jgi:hypothetical protein
MLSSYQTQRPAARSGWAIPPAEGLRIHLVSALLSMSAALLHLAVRLQHAQAASKAAAAQAPEQAGAPQLEYYAEAGAPEGALYVNGQLAGWISGVSRL